MSSAKAVRFSPAALASRLTLIDGRSGSGKTTLAAALARSTGAQLLSLDDVYPGWDGLEAAEAHVRHQVLEALAAGRQAQWRRWNWADARPGSWTTLNPDRPLVVEGCGTLSARSRALAQHGIWVQASDAARKRRALERDGELFAREWERWARQEEWHDALHDPRAYAEEIIET